MLFSDKGSLLEGAVERSETEGVLRRSMMNMNYYQISAEELGKNAKVPLLKLGDSGEVFYEIALEMVN